MANELKMVFSASPTTVLSISTAIANAANTYDGLAATTTTALNNQTDLYPYAKAVLDVPSGFSASTTAGGTVDLYMQEEEIDGTSDETPLPAATDIVYLAKYVGSWVLDNSAGATAYRKPIVISLEGVKQAKFHIMNNSGVTLNATTTATVKVTPFTYAPGA